MPRKSRASGTSTQQHQRVLPAALANAPATPLPKQFTLILRNNDYFAQADGGPEFYVGSRTKYQEYKGLYNLRGTANQRYDRTQYHTGPDAFWADFIAPTAAAEGGLFHTLNTYDRARFTFGFLQYAAHVPNGDFVRYLRALLALPLAPAYFPDLAIVDGHVNVHTGTLYVPLETDASTENLMTYLNPTATNIEDVEVIQAAKFVHWVDNDPAHAALQVKLGIQLFKTNLYALAQRYALDGRPADQCLVVADISHQGRAMAVQIRQALASQNPLEALRVELATSAKPKPDAAKH